MIIKHRQEILKSEMVVDSILCNKCGKPIEIIHNYGIVPHDVFEDYLHATMHYTMKDSGVKIEEFDLCKKCVTEFIQAFKIPANEV